jgi:adenosylhomocysteine nucleosidase
MMKITLLSALPHEYAAFKKLAGPWLTRVTRPFRVFSCSAFQKDLNLIETGMGKGELGGAFQAILEIGRPDLIVSMGFAGSLSAELDVGKVVLGNRFLHLAQMDGGAPHGDLGLEPHSGLVELCLQNGIGMVRVVTTERPELKSALTHRFADTPSVVDMETYFLCRRSLEKRIPFLSIRSISDGADEEIDFDLDAISDAKGRVSAAKAVVAVVRKPRLAGSFFHLWRNSRKAADSLGNALVRLLSLPESELRQIVLGSPLGSSGMQDSHRP